MSIRILIAATMFVAGVLPAHAARTECQAAIDKSLECQKACQDKFFDAQLKPCEAACPKTPQGCESGSDKTPQK